MAADVLLQVLADDEPALLDHSREVAGLATHLSLAKPGPLAAPEVFSAMREDRPNGAVLTDAEAVEELHRCSGTQFDPRVVRAFCHAHGASAVAV